MSSFDCAQDTFSMSALCEEKSGLKQVGDFSPLLRQVTSNGLDRPRVFFTGKNGLNFHLTTRGTPVLSRPGAQLPARS